MDTKSITVTDFLIEVEKCKNLLGELRTKLHSKPQIKYSFVARPEFSGIPYHKQHADGSVEHFHEAVHFIVSATLHSGLLTEWLIQLYWNETHWLLETAIYTDSKEPEHGMTPLREFDDRYAETFELLSEQLKLAAQDVINSEEVIDEVIASDEKQT